jgi:exonuclease SbcC
MDESTGDPRPTTSLSGGETFYASLSLALGLADVVQSETGGVSLETLFVDEGFGSLDTDTLERVLDQLDQLKSGGRTIGVISHVSEMKDRFPDRIVVSRDVDGPSHIMQT